MLTVACGIEPGQLGEAFCVITPDGSGDTLGEASPINGKAKDMLQVIKILWPYALYLWELVQEG